MARREKAVILTFDSDFANILAYPPGRYYGIIRIAIEPPFIQTITERIRYVFRAFPSAASLCGKLIILEAGAVRVWDEKYDD